MSRTFKPSPKYIFLFLTVYFIFQWGIGMEDVECMYKFFELNHTIFLFIKKIKNLEFEETIKLHN